MNVSNWIIEQIEKGELDENQVVVVYDKNNNISYLGKAQFAPLNLWDTFKHVTHVNHEYRINERLTVERRPVMLRIVALSTDFFMYQVKICGEWKQFKKPVGKFIHMMYVLFPDVMKQADKYKFDDMYQLANWIYNYGEEIKPCDTYIFYNK